MNPTTEQETVKCIGCDEVRPVNGTWSNGLTILRCPSCKSAHWEKSNKPRAKGADGKHLLADDWRKKALNITRDDYSGIFEKAESLRTNKGGPTFSGPRWLEAGCSQELLDGIVARAKAQSGAPEPTIFGFKIAKPTRFGLRTGPHAARQSGINPSQKGRENELAAIEQIRRLNPTLQVIDVAQSKDQQGYDIELWKSGQMVGAVDSSSDKVLQANEWRAMLRLAEKGIPYFIFLAGSKRMYPVTPGMKTEVAAYRV